MNDPQKVDKLPNATPRHDQFTKRTDDEDLLRSSGLTNRVDKDAEDLLDDE